MSQIQAPLLSGGIGEDIAHWSDWTPQLLSIILTALVIVTICLIYNAKIRAHKEGTRMSGFLVLIEMFVTSVENLVVGSMGKRYRKLTPYAMYIIMYIFIGSILSLFGIESLATSYTVPLSMGLVTFVCVYYFGFKYQKFGYFKRYKNPLEIATQFTPLISISFRLFGNLLGGSIILGLVYAFFIGIQSRFDGNGWQGAAIYNAADVTKAGTDPYMAQYVYFWTGFNIFTTMITPWLHMYFDLFDAGIQSIVFTMLTLSYWQEAMGEGNADAEPQKRGVESSKKAIATKGSRAKTVQVTV